jgi:hypothetical protein
MSNMQVSADDVQQASILWLKWPNVRSFMPAFVPGKAIVLQHLAMVNPYDYDALPLELALQSDVVECVLATDARLAANARMIDSVVSKFRNKLATAAHAEQLKHHILTAIRLGNRAAVRNVRELKYDQQKPTIIEALLLDGRVNRYIPQADKYGVRMLHREVWTCNMPTDEERLVLAMKTDSEAKSHVSPALRDKIERLGVLLDENFELLAKVAANNCAGH